MDDDIRFDEMEADEMYRTSERWELAYIIKNMTAQIEARDAYIGQLENLFGYDQDARQAIADADKAAKGGVIYMDTLTKLRYTKEVTFKKCECGSEYCNKYLISSTMSDGRFEKADAMLYAASPKMLAMLVDLYNHGYSMHNHRAIKQLLEEAIGEEVRGVLL
jgi:hypothetical protein